MDAIMTMTNTMMVETVVSFRVGQETLATSRRTSRKNSAGFVFAMAVFAIIPDCEQPGFALLNTGIGEGADFLRGAVPMKGWQEWRGSNPQPPVLETGALPIELHSYAPDTSLPSWNFLSSPACPLGSAG